MSILLGVPVWYGNRPFERTIEELYRLDLDYFEFSLDYPLPDSMIKVERESIKGLLEDFGLKIAFHSPLDIAVTHPRDELAEASITVLRKCMKFTADFMPRSLYYNFHLHPRVPTFKLDDVRDEMVRKGLKRCGEIARIASEVGIAATVENDLVPFERSTMILEALLSLDLHLTFDVGHAILAELYHSRMKRRERSYLEYLRRWIENNEEKILVVHVHDCSLTKKQDHLSLGQGELDFDAVFELLKRTNYKYLLIETFWRSNEKEEMTYEELKRNIDFCKSYV
jgi:sugar phosphate isomerase/epimerase